MLARFWSFQMNSLDVMVTDAFWVELGAGMSWQFSWPPSGWRISCTQQRSREHQGALWAWCCQQHSWPRTQTGLQIQTPAWKRERERESKITQVECETMLFLGVEQINKTFYLSFLAKWQFTMVLYLIYQKAWWICPANFNSNSTSQGKTWLRIIHIRRVIIQTDTPSAQSNFGMGLANYKFFASMW